MEKPNVRPVEAADFSEWKRLFLGYADFYHMPMSDEMTNRVWSWLFDDTHVVNGVVAESGDRRLIGLAHYRAMPSPLRATEVGFLDDLFVDPDARGARVGEAMFEYLTEICRDRGWSKLRWMTADDNYRARTLYDRVATKTMWNLYELTP